MPAHGVLRPPHLRADEPEGEEGEEAERGRESEACTAVPPQFRADEPVGGKGEEREREDSRMDEVVLLLLGLTNRRARKEMIGEEESTR